MSKKLKDTTDKELNALAQKLYHQRYYNRWPAIDPKIKATSVSEYITNTWDEYSEFLDNGSGVGSVLNIKKLIISEIKEIEENIESFPDDADEIYRKRLSHNLNQLQIKKYVIERLLTQFAVHGKIKSTPDFKTTDIQKLALDIICKGKRIPNKREVLKEYIKIAEADSTKNVQDIFNELEADYDIKYSTFAGWVKKLNEQIERISLSQNTQ